MCLFLVQVKYCAVWVSATVGSDRGPLLNERSLYGIELVHS